MPFRARELPRLRHRFVADLARHSSEERRRP
jgi:hypothetical protein